MKEWREENGIRWRSLQPFGIEIDRDLAEPMAPEEAERFVGLFAEAGLVVAHGQTLSMQQQTELMAQIGPIMRRVGESGYLSTEGASAPSLSELRFHADGAYADDPFDAISLHAVEVVDGASSTRFAHAARAYASLPAPLFQALTAHQVEMISPTLETLAMRTCDIVEPEFMRRGERPTVVVNPRTGRHCLGVSEMHSTRLLGMDWAESRRLLNAVYDHLYAPDNVTEHVWRKGDIVIWDNVTLQHARGALDEVGKRVLQRVVVGADATCPHVGLTEAVRAVH